MRRRLLALLVMALLMRTAELMAADPDWHWLVVTEGSSATSERAAIVSALRALPRLPSRVAVIDADEASPDVRETLLGLDAFVVRGSRVVYVVRQSRLLRGAREAAPLHVHALAAVLWHEMAHADGADEREAREREEAIWTSFIRDGRVDPTAALRYLSALTRRPDDQMVASK
jgi:hypothetical protein